MLRVLCPLFYAIGNCAKSTLPFAFTIPPPRICSAPPFTQGRLFANLIITRIGRENKFSAEI